MKKCSYCGAEYSDDATACVTDQTPLDQPHFKNPDPIPPTTGEKPYQNTANLTFPDYQWSAKDAWRCLGMLVVFETLLGFLYIAMDWNIHGFYEWREHSPFGRLVVAVVFFGVGLLTAAYFARTDTLASFWQGFGLDRKPSEYVSYGLVAALILRFLGHFALTHGWGKGVANPEIHAFLNGTGQNRFLFLVPLLVFAPLCEEAFNRGFIYKAFRGSYSMVVSIVILLAWNALTHWNQYSHSYVAAIDLSMITIVLCYLREKSDSLWDCILCHFTFNASTFMVGHGFQ
jgi:membrane protease YdiL (CAAX protease family)